MPVIQAFYLNYIHGKRETSSHLIYVNTAGSQWGFVTDFYQFIVSLYQGSQNVLPTDKFKILAFEYV